MDVKTPLLSVKNIQKSFGTNKIKACDDINLDVFPGEVHAIIGENGAGKTTLMRILSGLLSPDKGEIWLNSCPLSPRIPFLRQGIAFMQQNAPWSPELCLWEHVMLGSEETFFINRQKTLAHLTALANTLGFDLPWKKKCSQVSHALLQVATLIAFLRFPFQVLLLDEPTATISSHDTRHILTLIRKISSGPTSPAILFITHKLDEVLKASDRVSILSSGKLILTRPTAQLDQKTMTLFFRQEKNSPQKKQTAHKNSFPPVLETVNLTVEKSGRRILDCLTFQILPGEIWGIFSRTNEAMMALEEVLCGLETNFLGRLVFRGQILNQGMKQRRQLGMAYVPSDRLGQGSSLLSSLSDNLIPYRLKKLSSHGLLRKKSIKHFFHQAKILFGLVGEPHDKLFTLSGGNIQKLILARELEKQPQFLLLAYPSWGLDLQAQKAMHQYLQDLACQGTAILLLSYEIEELERVCSKIGMINSLGKLEMMPKPSQKSANMSGNTSP